MQHLAQCLACVSSLILAVVVVATTTTSCVCVCGGVVATAVVSISLNSLVLFVQRGHRPVGKERLKELGCGFRMRTGVRIAVRGFLVFEVGPWIFCK